MSLEVILHFKPIQELTLLGTLYKRLLLLIDEKVNHIPQFRFAGHFHVNRIFDVQQYCHCICVCMCYKHAPCKLGPAIHNTFNAATCLSGKSLCYFSRMRSE